MKKLTAFLTALAASLCSLSALAADAADEGTYIPTLYFKVLEADGISVIPGGSTAYINVSELNGASELNGQIEVYIRDELLRTGQIYAKWVWNDDIVVPTGIIKPDEAGLDSPYDSSAASYNIATVFNAASRLMGVSYTNTHIDPLVPTGSSSDDLPLAIFDYRADISSFTAGRHEIAFKTEQPNVTNLAYRLTDGSTRDIRPNGDNAKSAFVILNDRPLGDIENNGTIDGLDASSALTAYAKASVGAETGLSLAEELAADVDGDGVVTGLDASSILSYYAYCSVQKDPMSFIEFLKNNTG